MYIEFSWQTANVYKVLVRTASMYIKFRVEDRQCMEFWFALANVYRVLLATIEHPLPLSRTPQDSVWFLRTLWQASFRFTLQLFQATTFDLTICKAIAQSV